MDLAKAVANRIAFLCTERGISINKLATLSGITQSTLNSIMKGESKNPQLATLIKICAGFEMRLKDFFDDPDIDNVDVD